MVLGTRHLPKRNSKRTLTKAIRSEEGRGLLGRRISRN